MVVSKGLNTPGVKKCVQVKDNFEFQQNVLLFRCSVFGVILFPSVHCQTIMSVFSPQADGPVIQQSAYVALTENKVTPKGNTNHSF